MKEISTCVLEPKGLDVKQLVEDINSNDLKIPEENHFRVPTMNRFGYMFTKFDPIVDKWLESIVKILIKLSLK